MRAASGARLDVAYGPRPRERFDYLPSGKASAPLLVFIHGGYWQSNEKDMFAFVSEGPRARGIDVAMLGYTLAPDVTLTDIVAEMHQAVSYLHQHAGDFGFDRDRIFVAGWSAGGHLTAAVAGHPAIRGGIPISGIFDLEPISLNYLNEKLSLSAEEIATLSPLRTLPANSPPLWLAVGGARVAGVEAAIEGVRGGGETTRAAVPADRTAGAPPLLHPRRDRQARRRADQHAGRDDRDGAIIAIMNFSVRPRESGDPAFFAKGTGFPLARE